MVGQNQFIRYCSHD